MRPPNGPAREPIVFVSDVASVSAKRQIARFPIEALTSSPLHLPPAPETRASSDSWTDRWVQSDWKKDEGTRGDFVLTAGKWFGNERDDRGIQTSQDARFYAVSADMGATFSNEGKTLVLQFSAKHEQKLDCGGGYIKLMPSSVDQKTFSGDSPYAVMFGPDICGASTKRVHAIFTDKTGKNLLTKKTIPCETDELTHVYTLVVHPNNTYAVLVDGETRESGDLEDHWDFLPPREISDPDSKKPEDWDDRARIPDETDVKPEGWDDIPETITDPEATKPTDWDDEDDGEWEPPTVPNPEFKGAWRQKTVENPAYKGAWSAPVIPNPEYVADDALYLQKDLRYVGFELWQVKSGSIFDNVLVTDDVEYARAFAEKTWGASRDAEKAMFEAAKKKQREEDDAEAKRLAAEAAENGDDEDAFGDDYDDLEPPKDEL